MIEQRKIADRIKFRDNVAFCMTELNKQKMNKISILLTACINPNGMSYTALQDAFVVNLNDVFSSNELYIL